MRYLVTWDGTTTMRGFSEFDDALRFAKTVSAGKIWMLIAASGDYRLLYTV